METQLPDMVENVIYKIFIGYFTFLFIYFIDFSNIVIRI